MGANQSAVYARNEANELFTPQKSGQVLTFHSSSKWRSHFQSSRQTNKLMVIHFTAAWCGPCRTMEPVIRDFAAKYAVAREDAVQALPAFILIKKGKTVDKVAGAEKAALQNKIEKCMFYF
uniref:Thioredoxin domain-containing protein n=1 Tax=Daucus carota subsp. sativus TaxID=79200 RepID=A0A175YIF7_DAUCS